MIFVVWKMDNKWKFHYFQSSYIQASVFRKIDAGFFHGIFQSQSINVIILRVVLQLNGCGFTT